MWHIPAKTISKTPLQKQGKKYDVIVIIYIILILYINKVATGFILIVVFAWDSTDTDLKA